MQEHEKRQADRREENKDQAMPESIMDLLAALEQEKRIGSKVSTLAYRLTWFVTILSSLIFSHFQNHPQGRDYWVDFIMFAVFISVPSLGVFGSLFMGFEMAWKEKRQRLDKEKAARCMASIEDVHAIGPLASLLEHEEPVRSAAIEALTRLLPRLQENDEFHLNTRQRACLYRALKRTSAEKEMPFLLTILDALKRIGDEEALPYVRQLAEAEAVTQNQRCIRQAAQECLSFLREQTQRQQANQFLLLPASATDMLVRPVAGAREEDTGELLRPLYSGEI